MNEQASILVFLQLRIDLSLILHKFIVENKNLSTRRLKYLYLLRSMLIAGVIRIILEFNIHEE